MSECENESTLRRTIDWKQGLLIALGVPILILPSIGYSASYLWAFSIALWGISVIQGFLQNSAFAEMVTAFPNASGLAGCAQEVFTDRKNKSKYDRGKFVGGFCAWSYWFAWTPVVAIFTMTIGTYLQGFVPALSDVNSLALNLILGAVIIAAMIVIGARGLSGGAKIGLILALITLVPLVIILVAPFITGDFQISNITSSWFPAGWSWSGIDLAVFFGLMGLAQWSACAWETAAVYGPEYKKPSSDVPKALFSCGIICLFLYLLTQTSVVGTLGVDGVINAPLDPLYPLALMTFGDIGSTILLILLIGAMILIIQTGFLGSSRTLYSMALEGNFPKQFVKTNDKGMPVRAMLFVGVFNMFLILLGNPVAVLAASSMGYVIAVSIALMAYVKSKRDPEIKKLERPFKAPRGWKYLAAAMVVYELVILLPCLAYLNSLDYGSMSTIVGAVVLLAFIPIWVFTQNMTKKNKVKPKLDEPADDEIKNIS